MEEQWIVDRAKLRQIMHEKPHWTNQQYADACDHSKSWVKKWKKRLRGTALDDESVLNSRSRARKTPPKPYHPDVIERILQLRDQPPVEVPRKIGPLTILTICTMIRYWQPDSIACLVQPGRYGRS